MLAQTYRLSGTGANVIPVGSAVLLLGGSISQHEVGGGTQDGSFVVLSPEREADLLVVDEDDARVG